MKINKLFQGATPFSKLLLGVAFLAILSLVGIKVVSAEWSSPTSAPPGGNVAAPLNVSGGHQTKEGSLTIGGDILHLSTGNLFFTTDDRGIFWNESGPVADPLLPHLEEANNIIYLSPGEDVGSQITLQSGVKVTKAGTNEGSITIDNTDGSKYLTLTSNSADSGSDIKSIGAPLYLNYGTNQNIKIGNSANPIELCLNDEEPSNPDLCIAGWDELGGGDSLWEGTEGVNINPRTPATTKVGIGTANPNTSLEIDSGAVNSSGLRFTNLTSASPAGPAGATVLTVDASGNIVLVNDNAGGGGLPAGVSGDTLRHDGSSWAATNFLYNSGAAVGINTQTPNQELGVNGDVAIAGGIYKLNGTTRFFSSCAAGNSIRVINADGTVTCESDSIGNDELAKVSANDTTAGYLNGKLVAGANITFTEQNDGGNETLEISSSGGGSGYWSKNTTPNPDALYPTDLTNYVGVGTNSATAQLHVKDGHSWGGDIKVDASGLVGGHNWSIISAGGDAGEGQGKLVLKDNTAAGTELEKDRLVIDTAGKVGIGTTAPTDKLHIYSSTGDTSALLESTASASYITLKGAAASQSAIVFAVGASEQAGIYWEDNIPQLLIYETGSANATNLYLKNGRVGINDETPDTTLDVNGSVAIATSIFKGDGSTKFFSDCGEGSSIRVINANGTVVCETDDGGGGGFWSINTTPTPDVIYPSDLTYYVGVGTDSASARLHVKDGHSWGSDIKVDATGVTSGRNWSVISTGGDAGEGQGKFLIKDNNAGTVRMTIDTAGNVGINTTAPSQKLQVDGNILVSTLGNTIQFGGSDISIGEIIGGDMTILAGDNAKFQYGDGAGNGRLDIIHDGTTRATFGTTAGIGLSIPTNATYELAFTGGNGANIFSGSADLYILAGETGAERNLRLGAGNTNDVVFIEGSSGEVGIGDTTPSYKLDVNGNANATQLCINTDCRAAWPSGIGGSGTATQVAFFSAGTTLSSNANLYWDNTNSRLGIGTSSPGSRLTVLGGDIALREDDNGNDAVTLVSGNTDGVVSLFLNGTKTIQLHSNSASNSYINAGNVGIGQTAPVGKFVVNNNQTGTGSSGDAIATYANTTNSAIYAQQNNAGGYAGSFSGMGAVAHLDPLYNDYAALRAINESTTSTGIGVLGVGGSTSTTNRGSYGVVGVGRDITGSTDRTVGVYGVGGTPNASTPSGSTAGVWGVGGVTDNANEYSYGVFGQAGTGTGTRYGVYSNGDLGVTGNYWGGDPGAGAAVAVPGTCSRSESAGERSCSCPDGSFMVGFSIVGGSNNAYSIYCQKL